MLGFRVKNLDYLISEEIWGIDTMYIKFCQLFSKTGSCYLNFSPHIQSIFIQSQIVTWFHNTTKLLSLSLRHKSTYETTGIAHGVINRRLRFSTTKGNSTHDSSYKNNDGILSQKIRDNKKFPETSTVDLGPVT